MVNMRIVIPPGQSRVKASASVLITRSEASELRDALDLVLATGRSGWNVSVTWGENMTEITLALELGGPPTTLNRV